MMELHTLVEEIDLSLTEPGLTDSERLARIETLVVEWQEN